MRVKRVVDGFLSTFGGPPVTALLRCASPSPDAAREVGSGCVGHATGGVRVIGYDVGLIAVHIAFPSGAGLRWRRSARVGDGVFGTGAWAAPFTFEDRGFSTTLKASPGAGRYPRSAADRRRPRHKAPPWSARSR